MRASPPADADHEADIVVLGYGVSGMAAAITAAKRGASVIVVEKQPQDDHKATLRMAGGIWMHLTDKDAGARYLERCYAGFVPPDLTHVMAERIATLRDWLASVDPDLPWVKINTAEHPHFDGAESVEVYQVGWHQHRLDPNGGTGKLIYAAFHKVVCGLGVRLLWSHKASALLRDVNGRVIGARAENSEGTVQIRARYGVVLGTGGFEHDEAAKQTYLPAYPAYFTASPAHTGDGLRMAAEVGADMWHMNQMVGRAMMGFPLEPDGRWQGFFVNMLPPGHPPSQPAPGYVIVDRFGERFADEYKQAKLLHSFFYELLKFDSGRGLYPRIPCFWIFDEKRRRAGPLTFRHVGPVSVGVYDWSFDNTAEIARGWISAGKTVKEAAAAAGVEDPGAAARAVDRYNESCSYDRADGYGRPPETLTPIAEPPFYCVKLWPAGPFTTGGPRRDAGCRILSVSGEAIAGLYGAGELGQISGLVYPADGYAITEALCTGQIAVETALADRVPD
ncbi:MULTISPECIES: FAD-dependent oxidoreductase [unclassified Chelatococcus]|uniref:FAD-dependent oxidoreductase n=1 Tax=unclassified Chelatococcus TaxID=2638111 RepID=UPI001BCB858F|nr:MULTISPECIES: FAD-dependent oxidoreductase [unclassified Chelatococcus]MBS7743751.1 FAD-dependent oxidoreductase [Chelatococcus sp. HY11]MBX3547444.1 FAD-dependent oxidoreductase [Chelatococcus sp.]CAH1664789.1 Fumarate reductase flavoprotein subunit [Hyphomicrobiales bacterium]CAH1688570.1 Fumarate reductase flavoprotein subunit [Hyphomicrobiales bacterium]